MANTGLWVERFGGLVVEALVVLAVSAMVISPGPIMDHRIQLSWAGEEEMEVRVDTLRRVE